MRPGCTQCEFSCLVDSLCERGGKEPCPHCNGRCGEKSEKRPMVEIVLPKAKRRKGKGTESDQASPLEIILPPVKGARKGKGCK